MKTFKEYRTDKNKLPAFGTQFGQHSTKKLPTIETGIGSRNVVNESNFEPYNRPDAETADIHDNIAPVHTDRLTDTELAAVNEYTSDSAPINRNLHYAYEGSDTTESRINSAKVISSALSKHKSKKKIIVYTGIKKSPAEHFDDPNEPVEVHHPAFISTSTDPSIAADFAGGDRSDNDAEHGIEHSEYTKTARHMLQLEVPAGVHCMSVKKHSWSSYEDEVLADRGHKLRIHPHPTHLGDNLYMWKAKIIRHRPEPL